MIQNQIKSKERVKDLAEVYTNEREVNAMLDLVNESATKINSKFLEPSCGNGNFLVKILERKMKTVASQYSSLKDYEFFSLKALASIYAIDICPENVQESRERMFNEMINYFYLFRNSDLLAEQYQESIKYILERVIIEGNTLEISEDMIFSDFTTASKFYFVEKKYKFSELFNKKPKPFEIKEKMHYLKLKETI